MTSGSTYCRINEAGCATDGVGPHGNSERCTISVRANGTLTATFLRTRSTAYISIGGIQYHGSSPKLRDIPVAAGSNFTWYSSSSGARGSSSEGWTICFASNGTSSASPRYGASTTGASATGPAVTNGDNGISGTWCGHGDD